ncbi:Glycosyltransferase 61 [Gracilaria domingensis]|nr:Glycosyltransferase 61 [Gracilaria domingensis]
MVESLPTLLPNNISKENSPAERAAEKSYVANEGNGTLRAGSDKDHPSAEQNTSSGGGKQNGPFSVQIEDQNVYGGLVTYIHSLHPARICRVLNACLRHDGTLVLPKWMQRHDNLLSFHCGQKKLEFSADDGSPPPSLKDLDLVGLSLPRPSIPDFVRDFVPNAVVFDLIYGDRDVRTSCHSRKGSSCESFPSLTSHLNTAIFLPPRVEALEQKQSWVREFIKLMKPPSLGKQAKVLYNYPDTDEETGMQCFRSAFFTRGPFTHGISKAARVLREIRSGVLTPCHMNITISNRKLNDDDPKQLVGRYITNIPSLRTEIMKQADRVPGLNIHVAAITLEGKSLWWQINAMQKTDIWVAGHGPLLTNMIFMRQNSTVIEIQPFAYYPQVYERIAQHLAHVNQTYPQSHGSYNEVRTLHDRYLRASKKFFQSDSTHSLVLHTLEGKGLDYVRACARMQRLTTNARNFAIAIVRQARIRCGLPPPKAGESEPKGEMNLTI